MPSNHSTIQPLVLHRVSCPLCGDNESRRLFVAPDWYCSLTGDDDFAIERCRSCGHVFMNPAPTAESIPRCYPDGYAPHKSETSSLEAPPSPREGLSSKPERLPAPPAKTPWYLSSVVRRIPGLRRLYYWLTDTRSQPVPPGPGVGQRALEIGCGAGNYLVALREAGWDAEGLDLVAAAVEVSREKGFAVHHGDLASFPAEPQTYDGVFAWMVLEHLPRPRETLAVLSSLLKPNGCFGFSVPNYGSGERVVFGRYWAALELPRHLQQYTPAILKQLLIEAGFTDIQIIHQPSLLNAVGSVGYWLRDRFPRSRWGPRLVVWFFENPPLAVTLAIAPWAHFLAAIRQSGRLTVFARRTRGA